MSDSSANRPRTGPDATRTIDLNADLGEGCPNDPALLGLVSSASICCGAHAGDPDAIRGTLRVACDRGVNVGAHPGYADRGGFGRREQAMPSGEVQRLIVEQVEYLRGLAAREGVLVRFLKPHGSLYNQAQRQDEIARGVVAAAVQLRLPLLGQPGSLLEEFADKCGLHYVAEGFPDRKYRHDGSLIPRDEEGAVLHDPAEIEDNVALLTATPAIRTLCIHGDEPRAVENAERVGRILRDAGVIIRDFLS